MFDGAFVTLLALTLSSPQPVEQPAAPVTQERRLVHRGREPHQRRGIPVRTSAGTPDELYSLRARRRFASYLRLRLLEMRKSNLERAAAVIERRLPLDALFPGTEHGSTPQP